MKTSNTQKFTLGLFVIIGLILLVLAVYLIGQKKSLFSSTTQITSVFKNTNGLQTGNNVRYSGVNVGTVKAINILNDTAINVDMLIDEKSARFIRKSSQAMINSDGLVGSMVVNLMPGENKDGLTIKAGDTLESVSQVATADMLFTLNKTNENAALLTSDLLKITNAINAGEGVLGHLLKDSLMANNLQQSLVNINKSSQSASITLSRLQQLSQKIEYNENSIAATLLSDSSAAIQIKNLLENLENSSENIEALSENLKDYSREIKEARGGINYVVKDSVFVENLDMSIKNIEAATRKFEENMEALKHNFLFRGYFRRLERQQEKEKARIQDSNQN
ncbi:MlaD family protein [Salegentibacter sp. HM20]